MPTLIQDREANKKVIGEYLRSADRFIKSSEFSKALEEVNKALAVEPNNMYALAYNERIKVALDASRKKEEEEKVKKLAEDQKKAGSPAPSPAKPADAPPRASNAPDAKPQPSSATPQAAPRPATQVPGDDMIVKIKKEAQEAADKKADERIEVLKKEFGASQLKLQEEVASFAAQAKAAIEAKEKLQQKLSSNGQASGPDSMDLLKTLFRKASEDGAISADERTLLVAAKESLGVSDDGFKEAENESRTAAYVTALRGVWKDGSVTPEEADQLEQLRKKYNITAEEHFKIEGLVRKESQRK